MPPTGKYVNIGGAIKVISGEYTNIGGAIKPVSVNSMNIGGTIRSIPFAKYLFACEQFSDYLYGLDDTPTDLWYHSAAAWDSGKTYSVGELAYWSGQTYECILSHTNHTPPNPTYWKIAIIDPLDVAVDSDGNSYWACAGGVAKLNLAGVIQWFYTGHGTTVYSVCVDADGYVYSGDLLGVVKKLSPSGTVEWTKTLGTNYTVICLAVDHSAGRLYAGTGLASDAVYSLVTLNGNATKIYTCPYGDVLGIAVDEGSPTSLYIGTNTGYLMKISTGGYVYWAQAERSRRQSTMCASGTTGTATARRA
jgi:hypothetical protein